jgi:hypothetical protein
MMDKKIRHGLNRILLGEKDEALLVMPTSNIRNDNGNFSLGTPMITSKRDFIEKFNFYKEKGKNPSIRLVNTYPTEMGAQCGRSVGCKVSSLVSLDGCYVNNHAFLGIDNLLPEKIPIILNAVARRGVISLVCRTHEAATEAFGLVLGLLANYKINSVITESDIRNGNKDSIFLFDILRVSNVMPMFTSRRNDGLYISIYKTSPSKSKTTCNIIYDYWCNFILLNEDPGIFYLDGVVTRKPMPLQDIGILNIQTRIDKTYKQKKSVNEEKTVKGSQRKPKKKDAVLNYTTADYSSSTWSSSTIS